jgi:peptidyl-prolyl cis-trans isomerase SurA
MTQHMRSPVLALLGLVTLLGAGRAARAEVVERIVAVVNKEIVLLSDIAERIAPMRPRLAQIPNPMQRKQQLAKLRQQVLEQLINQKLIQAEARRLKISVTEAEISKAIKDVMRRNKLTEAQLSEALRQEGKTLHAYKYQLLKPQLLRYKVINMKVRPRVTVAEDEIKALYQQNMRALGVEEKVRARHIFVSIPARANAKIVAERRKLALSYLAKAKKKSADFAALAKAHSQDSVTRADGGDLGWFSRGTLPVAVEDVVFAMKKDEIKGPLRTARGFHIIQVTGKKESSARPYKEVRKTLKRQIFGEKMQKATKSWLLEVRKRNYVDVRL